MSGSTGNPLNLNKFDGTDDVVRALTDLFNQNMDLINKGDIHVKVWQPNTAYQKADIVMHPYQSKLIYSYNAHTSSNSNTEADWGTNDGSKWASLSFTPNVIPWQANNYFQGNDIFFDGNELKKATQSGASSTLDRTASSFVGSRIAVWTPNTKYNVGDLVYVKLLGSDDTGKLSDAILRCASSHISGITIPASSTGTWILVNKEAYNINFTTEINNGIRPVFNRVGKNVSVFFSGKLGNSVTNKNNQPIKSYNVLPFGIKPAFYTYLELKAHYIGSGVLVSELSANTIWWSTNETLNVSDTNLRGSTSYVTYDDEIWAESAPV